MEDGAILKFMVKVAKHAAKNKEIHVWPVKGVDSGACKATRRRNQRFDLGAF